MFKNFIHHVQDKYNNMVEENHHFQQLLQTTTTFHNLFPLPDNDREISDHLITYITNDSPDINEAKAYIIARLIPIDEIYLMVVYARESLTGKEYYLVSTSKKFYVICHDGYLCYPYENLACEVVKSNLMGKTILFSNILLEVNGSEKKLQTFLSILNDFSIREKMIQEKSKYLCGIVPIYQNINSIGSGISIDANSTIVFHTRDFHYKCRYSDIQVYEILLDNQIYYSSKNMSNVITNSQGSCYQISIRIVMNDGRTFLIPILEPSAFATKYQRQDKTFQDNLQFAQKIVDKIISLNDKPY